MKKQHKIDEVDDVDEYQSNEIATTALQTADDFAEQMVSNHFAGRYGAPQSSITEWLEPVQFPSAPSQLSQLLTQRKNEVAALARNTFSTIHEADRWFNTRLPVALKNQTPLSTMTTIDGCDKVKKLLNELYS